MMTFLKKRWVYHSLAWAIFFLMLISSAWANSNEEVDILAELSELVFVFLPVILAVYLHFWLKTRFFDTRQYLLYLISLIVLIFLTIQLIELVHLYKAKNFNNHPIQNVINVGFFLVLATGAQYLKRGIIGQYQIQELRAKTAETELNALKAQINPHFLFNTLNNIYAVNKMDSERGGEMLLELSEVMRYHLRFSKLEKVAVEEELQLIKAYIELEKLRLTEHCDLQLNFEPLDEQLKIAPLIFLPFIENAFKHGTHPMQSCFVHLNITSEGKKVHFELSNSIIHQKKVVKTNIGLENTKRRLEIIYPNQHQLTSEQNDNSYTVNLTIDV